MAIIFGMNYSMISITNYLPNHSWPPLLPYLGHLQSLMVPTSTSDGQSTQFRGCGVPSYYSTANTMAEISRFFNRHVELRISLGMFVGFIIVAFLALYPLSRQFIVTLFWYQRKLAETLSLILHTLYEHTHFSFFLKLEIKAARTSENHSFLTLWAIQATVLWIHSLLLILISSHANWLYMVEHPDSYQFWFLWLPWSINVVPISAFCGCFGGTLSSFYFTHPHYSWRRRFQATSRELDWRLPRDYRPELERWLWPRINRFHRNLLINELDRTLLTVTTTREALAKRVEDQMACLVMDFVFAAPVLYLEKKTEIIADLESKLGMQLDPHLVSMALGVGHGRQSQRIAKMFTVWFPLKSAKGKRLGRYGRSGFAKMMLLNGCRPKDTRWSGRMCYFCFQCRQFHSFQNVKHCD